MPGWQLIGDPTQITADLDATMPQEGQTCLYLQNRGNGTATIESETFATPPTGQLVMWVFVRGENVAPNSELRLVFEVDGDRQAVSAIHDAGRQSVAEPLSTRMGCTRLCVSLRRPAARFARQDADQV